MKITAFVGSARKKHTYNAVNQFLNKLKSFGDIEYEIIRLSEYDLKICNGCKLCLDKGEELCPLKDDIDILIKKMMNSDGIIFASPNYSFHISGIMKVFLDRLAYLFHRPQFFGKTYTNIVTQGIYGGSKIIKYLDNIGDRLGFNVVRGCCIKTLEPISEKQKRRNDKKINELSKKYYFQLIKHEYPTPTTFKLMLFRMSRSSIQKSLNEEYKDYRYYREKGWFESGYYYPVKLNLFKKLLGNIFDKIGTQMSNND